MINRVILRMKQYINTPKAIINELYLYIRWKNSGGLIREKAEATYIYNRDVKRHRFQALKPKSDRLFGNWPRRFSLYIYLSPRV